MDKFSIIKDGRPLINEDGTTKYYYDKEQTEAMVNLLKITSPQSVINIKEDYNCFDEEEFVDSCDYCVLVGDKISGEIVHMTLYKGNPTDDDINELKHELATDETFGLVETRTEDLSFIVINKHQEGVYDYR